MAVGFDLTVHSLTSTANTSAEKVLLAALESSHDEIRFQAARALLSRKGSLGHREVLYRLDAFEERLRDDVERCHGRMSKVLRDALASTNRKTFDNALIATLWMREYDQMPRLLSIARGAERTKTDRAVEVCLDLVTALHAELTTPRDYSVRRDPQIARGHALTALEDAVQRYPLHKRRELVEAFLVLADRANATFQRVAMDGHHAAHRVVIDKLTHSSHPGVIRLLVSSLSAASPPAAILDVASQRADRPFIEALLDAGGRRPPKGLLVNLGSMNQPVWLGNGWDFVYDLTGERQAAVVRLARAARITEQSFYSLLRGILKHGEPEGRLEAAATLTTLRGKTADELCILAMEDESPEVVALVAGQLRNRSIPGALNKLLDLVNTEDDVVREAVRASLSEFNAAHYIRTYDGLADGMRQRTGQMVKRVDPDFIPLLREELHREARASRIRALRIIRELFMATELQSDLISLLSDGDSFIRAEAVETLALSQTGMAAAALQAALHDDSEMVKEAAERSLAKVRQVAAQVKEV